MSGIYLINKPTGITSHDVVAYLRRVTGEKTIGHAGTLDPLASGLMIVAIGREFTKQISRFAKLDKEYIASVTLGGVSSTFDREGEITSAAVLRENPPSPEELKEVLQSFFGEQQQVPPIFSAKKIAGAKAYDLARKGKSFSLSAVTVRIFDIELLEYKYPELKFRVKVSSGTYIRSLADELGKRLGTGAYLSGLIRTAVDKYTLSQAAELDKIKSTEDLALRTTQIL